jgi:3-oxoacyl-[acyl-carrier-protein] synthase II
MNRVAVTGLGVVSPLGSGREVFWRECTAGHSGIGPITLFDVSAFPVRIGGQVRDVDVPTVRGAFPGAAKERDRKIFLGLVAAAEAIRDAALPQTAWKEAQVHLGVGLEAFFVEDLVPFGKGGRLGEALPAGIVRQSGGTALQTPLDRLAEIVGRAHGIHGPRYTHCAACAAGAQAIGQAFRELQHGHADVALAGAADSMLNPLGLGGFSLLRVLSTENDQPQRACRPFEASRQGTVLGEGAAFLVLERWEQAQARGAPIYAEILGYGASMDAYHVTDPEPGGRGAVLCMQKAVRDAGLDAAGIDAINAHGTGTPKNDWVEAQAIGTVFGRRAREIPVSAIKSMTGHLIGASGAVEAAASILTLSKGVLPPTINMEVRDVACDLDFVPNVSRPFGGNTVLSNSFGFGGQNATLIFRKVAHG